MLVVTFGAVLHEFLEAVLLKLHAKLAPGWALIRVNFDPIQEIGPKEGGGRSFTSGRFSQDYSILKSHSKPPFFSGGDKTMNVLFSPLPLFSPLSHSDVAVGQWQHVH